MNNEIKLIIYDKNKKDNYQQIITIKDISTKTLDQLINNLKQKNAMILNKETLDISNQEILEVIIDLIKNQVLGKYISLFEGDYNNIYDCSNKELIQQKRKDIIFSTNEEKNIQKINLEQSNQIINDYLLFWRNFEIDNNFNYLYRNNFDILEYQIFELIYLYKTINFEKQSCLLQIKGDK